MQKWAGNSLSVHFETVTQEQDWIKKLTGILFWKNQKATPASFPRCLYKLQMDHSISYLLHILLIPVQR